MHENESLPGLAGGVAQVVECLLCNHEALSSIPNPTKKKKKKRNFCAILYLTEIHVTTTTITELFLHDKDYYSLW
jgi:transcription elongation factor Elf1